MAIKLIPIPPVDRRRETVVRALRRAMEETLTEETWRELGYATNTIDWVNGHPRLLKGCFFGDKDYPKSIQDALDHMLDRDPANLRIILGFGEIAKWIRDNRPHVYRELPDQGLPAADVPPEIKESLESFRRDYPDPFKIAFLMMRFGKTKAHEGIIAGIRAALDPLGELLWFVPTTNNITTTFSQTFSRMSMAPGSA